GDPNRMDSEEDHEAENQYWHNTSEVRRVGGKEGLLTLSLELPAAYAQNGSCERDGQSNISGTRNLGMGKAADWHGTARLTPASRRLRAAPLGRRSSKSRSWR
ncbi:hypothetical protein, partial [Mesorhizobium sp.]|uniref:hypothetical protein n=1 Tax=Mesorhizobium sp. TaxID=1871066 RepID=UPI0025C63A54